MDPVFVVTREELHDVQMELRRIQHIQQLHGERLRTLEKRQADDAALKSVWNSPFPSVLGGTPQHGPVHVPTSELIDDLGEEGQNLLGTLHLEADDEPIRRGAASRANSVRFDESALHGASLGGHGGRHSSDFGPIRPGSGLGGGHHMMERSYSHKSDGRHSSAGHSVHSMHSGMSGRASSLGIDSGFAMGHDDDSLPDMPEPPPVLYILGSPPSIIRCWLTTNFTSSGLLYAVICTGSQKSTVEYSLLKELDLVNRIHRDMDGVHRITLPVFLAEARVTQSNSRSASPAPHLPSITAEFEVTGMGQPETPESTKAIRVFIGSHTLRLHGADILLSRNLMTLYGSDRDKLSIPFVRPEDDNVFKNLATANIPPSKPKLNAAAPEFVATDKSSSSVNGSVQGTKEGSNNSSGTSASKSAGESGSEGMVSPTAPASQPVNNATSSSAAGTVPSASENGTGGAGEKSAADSTATPLAKTTSTKEPSSSNLGTADPGPSARRESAGAAAIRTPWRQTAAALGDNSTPLSGYQPATRPRSMKVLRPTNKSGASSSSSTTRTGAAYEPAAPPRSAAAAASGADQRRKTQTESSSSGGGGGGGATVSWGSGSGAGLMKRSVSVSAVSSLGSGGGGGGLVPPSRNNPLGSASAFSWIAGEKGKSSGTSAE